MSLLASLFFPRRREPSELAYQRAMGASADLIRRMRESPKSNDAARSIVADVWDHHHNTPFLTSVYETVQEMKVVPLNGSRPRASKI